MTRLLLTFGLVLSTAAMADDTAQLMADGAPWDMQDPSGRTAKITLNPDGSGRVRLGLMGASAEWVHTDDGLCLTTRPLGEVCLILTSNSTGVIGTASDGGVFVFTR